MSEDSYIDVHAEGYEPEIKKRIREIDVSEFDTDPYTNPNVIRPLPAQEKFLLSHEEAQITFYGG